MEKAGVKAVVEGYDQYERQIKSMGKVTGDLGDDLQKSSGKADSFGKSVAGTALGFGAAELGAKALKGGFDFALGAAMNFEKGLDQVGAVSGATKGEMAQLSDTALRIGADTAFSASQAVGAMESLAANGITTADILGGAADAAANLAAAGGVDLVMAADTASTAMSVWGLKTSDLNEVVNRLAGAANTSRFGVEDMSAAIASGGGAASTAGVEFGDFTTVIAATANAFSSGSDAGTSFKTFITALPGNSEQAKNAIADLGLEFYDLQGNLRPMPQIVQELHDKLGPLSQEAQTVALKTIFGNDAFRTAAGLMKLTGTEFEAMSEKMRTTDAAEVARTRMENLSGRVEALKGSVETLGISIGMKLIPKLTDLAEFAAKAVNGFGQLPQSTQNMILMGTALAAMTPIAVKAASGIASLAVNLRNLNEMSAGAKLGGVAAGITAIGVALDIVLQKTTGHGLIETLYGTPVQADAAKAAAQQFKLDVEAIGPMADKSAIAIEGITVATKDYTKATGESAVDLGNFRDYLSPLPGVLSAQQSAAQNAAGAIQGYANQLVASGADFKTFQTVHDELNRTVEGGAAVFDKAIDYQGRFEANVKASAQATKDLDTEMANARLEERTAKWAQATEDAQRFSQGLKDTKFSAQELGTLMGPGWGTAIAMSIGSLGIASDEAAKKISAINFPNIKMSADELQSWLNTNFGPNAAKAFEKLRDEADKSFKGVVDAVKTILPGVDEAYTAWAARIDAMLLNQKNFESNLTTIYANIKKAGVAMPEEITASIAQQGPEAAANFAKYFASDNVAALDKLKQAAPLLMGETVDEITNRVIGGAPSMTTASTLFFGKMAEGASAAKPAVLAESEALATAATLYINQLATAKGAGSPYSDGMAVATGIAQGMDAGTPAIVSAAQRTANAVLEATRLILGIHSPSTVFRDEVGIPMMQGVAEGVTAGEPLVTSAITTSFGNILGRLHDGIANSTAMSKTEIEELFTWLASNINSGSLSEATRKEFEGLYTAMRNGWKATGSLSNAEVSHFVIELDSALSAGFSAFIETTESGWRVIQSDHQAAWEVVDGITRGGMAALQQSTGIELTKWQDALSTGLKTGHAMSTDELGTMFSELTSIVASAHLPEEANKKAAATLYGFTSGIAAGKGVANADLIAWLEELQHIIDAHPLVVAAPTVNMPSNNGGLTVNNGVTAQPSGPGPATPINGQIAPQPGMNIVWIPGQGWQYTPAPAGGQINPDTGVIEIGPGNSIPSLGGGIDFLTADTLAFLHQGEAVLTAAENRQRMDSMRVAGPSLPASWGGGGGGGSVTIDLRGSQFTGTLEENEAMMRRVARDAMSQAAGRDRFLTGTRLG